MCGFFDGYDFIATLLFQAKSSSMGSARISNANNYNKTTITFLFLVIHFKNKNYLVESSTEAANMPRLYDLPAYRREKKNSG